MPRGGGNTGHRSVAEDGEDHEHNERAEHKCADNHRSMTHGSGAIQIPAQAEQHEEHSDQESVGPCGCGRPDFAERQHEDRRVDGHIENTGHQRQPGFLKSPKRSHGAPDPDVKSSLAGDGG